jgi:hypothetical protein
MLIAQYVLEPEGGKRKQEGRERLGQNCLLESKFTYIQAKDNAGN